MKLTKNFGITGGGIAFFELYADVDKEVYKARYEVSRQDTYNHELIFATLKRQILGAISSKLFEGSNL